MRMQAAAADINAMGKKRIFVGFVYAYVIEISAISEVEKLRYPNIT